MKTDDYKALLEVIATKLATSEESVNDYIKKTLLCQSIDRDEMVDMVNGTLQDLEETQLIRNENSNLHATLLGEAIVASSLTPEDGIFIHKELRKSLDAFVMNGEMHVLYCFTPIQFAQSNINWQMLRREVEGLDENNMRVLGFVGIKPSIINKM